MARSPQPTARIFFALVPSPLAQRALGELARETARRALGRPVPAENIHVTLAFIGAWPIAQIPLLVGAASGVRGNHVQGMLDTLGAFPRAGIAWIGLAAPPIALMQLQASLAAALTRAAVPFDASQSFHPHATLARRCRGPYPSGAVAAIAFDVDRFSLMQSETRTKGARYRTLAEWPLS